MPAVVSTSAIPGNADRVVVLINPKAGPKDAQPWTRPLADRLAAVGIATDISTDPATAAAQADRWHAEGRLRALVAAGGDGTAAELVNRTADGVPLALMPTGNSNLLARYFHFRRDPEALFRTLVEGAAARIDAGLANGRIFLLMAGCGFDAEVVRRVHGRRSGHINIATYFKPVAEAAWRYAFPEMQIRWEDRSGLSERLSARWLFVFNLPCYGGGFRIAPHADGSDGMLDICGFRRGGRWSGLRYAAAIRAGLHRRLTDWTACRGSRMRITSGEPVPYQLDGDPGGTLPLDIQALPGRLTLLLPRESPD